MLAVGLDALEDRTVDPGGVGGETTLGAGDAERTSGDGPAVVAGDAVDRVAFGHRDEATAPNEGAPHGAVNGPPRSIWRTMLLA